MKPMTDEPKKVTQAIDDLRSTTGSIPTNQTMALLFAIRDLSSTLYQRGTVGIANLGAADALRAFTEALSDLKEKS